MMLPEEDDEDYRFFNSLDVAQLLENEFMRDGWETDVCSWIEHMVSDPDSPFDEDDIISAHSTPNVFSLIRKILADCEWTDARIIDFLNFVAATNVSRDFKGTLPIFDDSRKPMYELGEDATLVRTQHSVAQCSVELANVVNLTKSTAVGFALRKSSLNGKPADWPPHLRDQIMSAFSIKSRAVFTRLVTSIFPTIFGNAVDLREGDALLAVVNEINRLLAFDDQSSLQSAFEMSIFYGIVHSNSSNVECFDSYQFLQRRVESISKLYSSCIAYAHVLRNHDGILKQWDATRKSPIASLDDDLVQLILSFVPLQTRADCTPIPLKMACMSTPTGLQTDYGHHFVRGLGVELGLVPTSTTADAITTTPEFLKVASTHVGSRWGIRDFAISMRNVARMKLVCRGWRAPVMGIFPQIQTEKLGGGSELINGTFHVRVSMKRPIKRRTTAGYEDGFEVFPAWFLAFVSRRLEFSLGLERGDEHVQFSNRWKREKSLMHVNGFIGKPHSSNSIEIRRMGPRRYGRAADVQIDPNDPFGLDPSIQMLTYPSNLRSTAMGFEIALKICETSKALSRLNGSVEGKDDGVRVHARCGPWSGKTEPFKVMPRKRYDKPPAATARE
ncbi:hypothetical protein N9S30_00560 [bacterium]|nr:hypothetical protein [bacterium]